MAAVQEKTVASLSAELDWGNILTNGGPVGIAILVLLLLLSIVTWGVIVERWRKLNNLYGRSESFLKSFWEARSLSELSQRSRDMEYSPARELFRTGYNEVVRVVQAREKRGNTGGTIPFDTVKRSLQKARFLEEAELFKNMSLLAVFASACPFIGLLGTVVGIIRAFHDIGSSGSPSLASVAPGISEALIATALGLAAAIPASIFYNFLATRARRHLIILDAFAVDFLNILDRHFNVGKNIENGGGATQSSPPISQNPLNTTSEV